MDNNDKHLKDGFVGQRMVYVPGATIKKVLSEPKIKDLYITHIGHFPNAKGHYRERKNGCKQYILLYCKSGEGWIEMDGKTTIVQANTLVVIAPYTACSYGASDSDPWDNYWIHYSGENAQDYSPEVGRLVHILPGLNARIDDRMVLFEEMLFNMELLSNFDNVMYANICLKYFLTSIRQLDKFRFMDDAEHYNSFALAISFMKNNLKTRISLDDLSKASKCSKSNLAKLFKKNMHCSPMDYYAQLKMQRACKYLAHTNLKIKDVAQHLGFDDPYYFSRLFTKTIGKSPIKYRKEEIGTS